MHALKFHNIVEFILRIDQRSVLVETKYCAVDLLKTGEKKEMRERERKREKPREVNGCKSFGGKVSQGIKKVVSVQPFAPLLILLCKKLYPSLC